MEFRELDFFFPTTVFQTGIPDEAKLKKQQAVIYHRTGAGTSCCDDAGLLLFYKHAQTENISTHRQKTFSSPRINSASFAFLSLVSFFFLFALTGFFGTSCLVALLPCGLPTTLPFCLLTVAFYFVGPVAHGRSA